FQAEDGIRDRNVTGVQTCALPISATLMVSAGAAEEAAEDAPPAPVEAAVELEELPPQAARPTAAAPAPTILIKLRREMRFIVLSSNSIDSCPQAHRAVYAGNAGPPAEWGRRCRRVCGRRPRGCGARRCKDGVFQRTGQRSETLGDAPFRGGAAAQAPHPSLHPI